MAQWDKLLKRVLSGQADANIAFRDLCALLRRMGFVERIAGDHHIFTRPDVPALLNIQPEHTGKAKDYQVRQIRKVFRQYGLTSVP